MLADIVVSVCIGNTEVEMLKWTQEIRLLRTNCCQFVSAIKNTKLDIPIQKFSNSHSVFLNTGCSSICIKGYCKYLELHSQW